jgi:hypothetical protein
MEEGGKLTQSGPFISQEYSHFGSTCANFHLAFISILTLGAPVLTSHPCYKKRRGKLTQEALFTRRVGYAIQ